MKSRRAVFLKELVELAPVALLGVISAAWFGYEAASFRLWSLEPAPYFAAAGIVIGIAHGLLDRRAAANAFLSHRPVPDARSASMRWLAGVSVVTILVPVYVAGRAVGRWDLVIPPNVSLTPEEIEVMTAMHILGIAQAWAVALVAWSVLRACVARPGLVPPVVWTVVVPVSVLLVSLGAPSGWVWAVVLVGAFGLLAGRNGTVPGGGRTLGTRAALLLVVLAVGHAAIGVGQVYAFNRLELRYGGFIGFDVQDRVRHWIGSPSDEARSVVLLSADEVEPGRRIEKRPSVWRVDAGIELPERVHMPRMPAGSGGNDLRRSDDGFEYLGLASFGIGRSLHLCRDWRGAVSIWITGVDEGPRKVDRRVPVEGGVAWPPTIRRGMLDGRFAGVVNDEYWVLERDGRFVQRQELPFDLTEPQPYEYKTSRNGKLLFTFGGGVCRPDHVALKLVLLRPDREPLVRTVAIEPVIGKQKRLVAGWALLGLFRPPALNVVAATSTAPRTWIGSIRQLWLDPLLAEGANPGWLVASLAVGLACAFLAYRSAKLRCATLGSRTGWILAAVLLGPMGLVWIRMAMPWHAVEAGRAVDVGAWPPPESTGAEVFSDPTRREDPVTTASA
jgi:hypothetical protein